LKKSILKEIFGYIFRVCIFLLLTRPYCIPVILFIVQPLLAISDIVINNDDGIILVIMIAAISLFVYLYAAIKVCGLFKKLDNLNFFLSLPIVVLLDIIFEIWTETAVQIFPLKFSYHKSSFVYIILICYIIYKIFNILGRKFPMPFGKIGYYTSIEFWRSIAVKIWQNITKKYRTY